MGLPATLQSALAKIKQGPVQVMVDPDSTAIEIFVQDGVDLGFMRGLEEVETDILGVYDLRTTGDSAEFEIRSPERSQECMNVVFQGALTGTSGGYSYHGFGRTAGTSLRGNAKRFRFRPWQTRASQQNQVDLWLCAPKGDAALSQKKSEPHTWVQTYQGLPDPTKADGNLIGRIYSASR